MALPLPAGPSAIPSGWMPDDASARMWAIRDAAGNRWEVVVPEFGVAGVGDSPDEAANEALELLGAYLAACAAEGRSFEQSRRPWGWSWRFAAAKRVASSWWHERLRGRILVRFERRLRPVL